MKMSTSNNRVAGLLAGVMVLASLGSVGCQIDVAGQTLPSPYYLDDDVQYYAPGPEFKLSREAAQLKADREAYQSEAQPCCP